MAAARRRHIVAVKDEDNALSPTGEFVHGLQNLPDEYLACRDINHPWEIDEDYHIVDASNQVDVQPIRGQSRYVRRTAKCPRCGKTRIESFIITPNWTGLQHISTHYTDPKGFQIKGTGSMKGKRSLVRGEAFRRIIERNNGA